MLKIEDFLNKMENENLKFNDKVDIFHSNFRKNNKFKIQDMEDAEDYKIFKIIQLETNKEEFFIFTKISFNIFKIDYNYPIFI